MISKVVCAGNVNVHALFLKCKIHNYSLRSVSHFITCFVTTIYNLFVVVHSRYFFPSLKSVLCFVWFSILHLVLHKILPRFVNSFISVYAITYSLCAHLYLTSWPSNVFFQYLYFRSFRAICSWYIFSFIIHPSNLSVPKFLINNANRFYHHNSTGCVVFLLLFLLLFQVRTNLFSFPTCFSDGKMVTQSLP